MRIEPINAQTWHDFTVPGRVTKVFNNKLRQSTHELGIRDVYKIAHYKWFGVLPDDNIITRAIESVWAMSTPFWLQSYCRYIIDQDLTDQTDFLDDLPCVGILCA